jgi:hypothetical protein
VRKAELVANTGFLPILSETRPVRRADNVKTIPHADPISPISTQLAPIFDASRGEMGTPRPMANINRNVNTYWPVLCVITNCPEFESQKLNSSR